MSKITRISSPKVGIYVRFFPSFSTIPGLITGVCLKFLAWTDYLLCLKCVIFPWFALAVTFLKLAAMTAAFSVV